MKYYIKVENGYITDIITYKHNGYIEIEKDLWRFKYALHSGLYKYNDGIIDLDEQKELIYLEELSNEEGGVVFK